MKIMYIIYINIIYIVLQSILSITVVWQYFFTIMKAIENRIYFLQIERILGGVGFINLNLCIRIHFDSLIICIGFIYSNIVLSV